MEDMTDMTTYAFKVEVKIPTNRDFKQFREMREALADAAKRIADVHPSHVRVHSSHSEEPYVIRSTPLGLRMHEAMAKEQRREAKDLPPVVMLWGPYTDCLSEIHTMLMELTGRNPLE